MVPSEVLALQRTALAAVCETLSDAPAKAIAARALVDIDARVAQLRNEERGAAPAAAAPSSPSPAAASSAPADRSGALKAAPAAVREAVALVQAAVPAPGSAIEAVALAVHACLVAGGGFVCTGADTAGGGAALAGFAAPIRDLPKGGSSVPASWRDDPSGVAFRYRHPKHPGKAYVFKGCPDASGGSLGVHLADKSKPGVVHTIDVPESVCAAGADHLAAIGALLRTVTEKLCGPLLAPPPPPPSPPAPAAAPRRPLPPQRPGGRVPGFADVPDHMRPDAGGWFDGDLGTAAGGRHPMPGLGGIPAGAPGGMHMGPNHPFFAGGGPGGGMFPGGGPGGGPGGPGGGVPPGARFDPYGPGPRGGHMDPDPDHMQLPGRPSQWGPN